MGLFPHVRVARPGWQRGGVLPAERLLTSTQVSAGARQEEASCHQQHETGDVQKILSQPQDSSGEAQ